MWRFLLRQNVDRYRKLLDGNLDPEQRSTVAGLLSETEEEMAELEALSTGTLPSIDTYLQIFAQHALDDVVALHSAQFGHLQLYDPGSASLVTVAQKNFRAPFLKHFANVKLGDGSAPARVLACKKQVIIEDVTSDHEYEPHRDIARATGYRAVQSTPLLSDNDEVLGTLTTFFGAPRDFSQGELDQFNGQAEHIASHFGDVMVAN